MARFSDPGTPTSPPGLYLTWFDDPSTTMVLRAISHEKKLDIYYQREGDAVLRHQGSKRKPLAGSDYFLHTFNLKDLKSDSKYQIGFAKDSLDFYFRTLAKNYKDGLRFIIGGDMYHDKEHLIVGNRLAAQQNPDFVVLGGDLAYSLSKRGKKISVEDMQRWLDWLELWKAHMKGSDGRVFPLLAVIGNHEVIGKYRQRPANARGFYSLFMDNSKRSYRSIDMADGLSFVLLDSDHSALVEGAQEKWLEKTLKQKADYPYCFAVYHVPAYPSFRALKNKRSSKIRKHWVPLFDKYAINAAFEHHDHNYKRSYPLLGGKIDPKGVLYIGDGGWGSSQKSGTAPARWYIEKSQAIRNFVVIDLDEKAANVKAIGHEGQVIDEFSIMPRKVVSSVLEN